MQDLNPGLSFGICVSPSGIQLSPPNFRLGSECDGTCFKPGTQEAEDHCKLEACLGYVAKLCLKQNKTIPEL